MVKGIGAAAGIAIGKAFVLPTWEWDLPDEMIDVTDLAKEFERLYEGIRTSKDEIEYIKKEISDVVGHEESNIFDAHLAILDDPVFMNEIRGIIQRQYKAAEVAVKEVIDKFVNMFDLLDDEYMKERALDIKDVGNRLLKHLIGSPDVTLPSDNQPFILVAKEVSPSQLAHLNPANVLGIATLLGGTTSHSAIMARALGIPLVSGLEGKFVKPVTTGDHLIIDGEEGVVHVNPGAHVIARYTNRKTMAKEAADRLQDLATVPAITSDGFEVQLEANISSLKELEHVLRNGASGVGLFRTELLYMDRTSLPTEEEQFTVYKEVAERMGGNPSIIRTLDIGGDKQLDYFALPEEENPFLGYRAIRICLEETGLFRTQLRAILRASAYGQVKIMYPMISSVEEIREANRILSEVKEELKDASVPFQSDIAVGIMIEVPAAAQIADVLAEEVDFFSIGTNDLVQYVLAVDRMNEKIAHLYEPYHPAVLRLLKFTVESAQRKGIPVGVCGEMAGDIKALPIWLGLGVQELSMSVQSLLKVKDKVLDSSKEECVRLTERLLKCGTSSEMRAVLDQFNSKITVQEGT
ncbi:phosphoenolpyruvate-protein phosphotransferase [Paenibacillus swuensis]|uniref:Phosphoenolpyruvate-protein phosphotransferase n=1 Tax=Paenibacillus swuensis TaxID=1178515 RepID=A0A172TKD5_9BACL|nr:phosphoenolpyruvate--protein phosphotransferase [Paenibacillus swuensis]ANE47436.1 phosphoenolpyruvate-protein phosphotransferase [Paenibacillus swuensis]